MKYILGIVLGSVIAYFTVQRGPVIFKTSFESPSIMSGWKMAQKCCDLSLQRSDSIARSGKYSLRVSLNSHDPNVAGGKRSEFSMGAERSTNFERWYGFSIFLPNDYQLDDQSEIVAQWHDAAPAFLIRSPPIALHLFHGQWRIAMFWGAKKFTDKATANKKLLDLGAFEKNKWTDFVFHIKFSYNDDGVLEIWKDGVQVMNYKGPNCYNDDNGPYFKVGIYKYPWNGNKNLPSENKVLYFDDIAIGNETAKYDDVAPGRNSN